MCEHQKDQWTGPSITGQLSAALHDHTCKPDSRLQAFVSSVDGFTWSIQTGVRHCQGLTTGRCPKKAAKRPMLYTPSIENGLWYARRQLMPRKALDALTSPEGF